MSVIVFEREEGFKLRDVVASVFDQDFKQIEVLVKAQHASVEDLGDFPVEVLPIRSECLGKELNEAFAVANGPFVVVLDSRGIPRHHRWLNNLLDHFSDPEVAAVCGHNWDPELIIPNTSYRQDLSMFLKEPRYGLSNINAAYRRSLWERQPFNESLKLLENRDWALKVLKEGYSIVMEYAASIHFKEETPTDIAAFKAFWEECQAMATVLTTDIHPWRSGLKRAWRKRDTGPFMDGMRAALALRRLRREYCRMDVYKARERFRKLCEPQE